MVWTRVVVIHRDDGIRLLMCVRDRTNSGAGRLMALSSGDCTTRRLDVLFPEDASSVGKQEWFGDMRSGASNQAIGYGVWISGDLSRTKTNLGIIRV